MWELDCEESWAQNWCFCTVVLEKTLESPLDCKGIKPVNRKGNQYWIFPGRSDIVAEAPVIWQHDANNTGSISRKNPDAGKDWRREEKMSEDEMVGLQHWLNGHEFWVSYRKWRNTGSLAYCSPWGRKELDMPEWLDNNSKYPRITPLYTKGTLG